MPIIDIFNMKNNILGLGGEVALHMQDKYKLRIRRSIGLFFGGGGGGGGIVLLKVEGRFLPPN